MNGHKAKEIRRQMQSVGLSTKTKVWRRLASGQIVADDNRRIYQLRKDRRNQS